jgi:hypothetical protein
MRILFDEFKGILKQAVGYSGFVGANTILADATTKQSLLDRIDALRSAFTMTLEHDDVMATGGIIGTLISVDHLNREIDFAVGALGTEDRAIFNLQPVTGQFLPPLEIQGWLVSPDSTILPSDIEIHYRFLSSDPWHKLLQQDDVRAYSGIQLSVFLPLALMAPKVLKKLIILANQV